MFVFPAHNSSFKSRKRVFRCCERCRIKRIKCNMLVDNFSVKGCETCQKKSATCSLVVENTKTAQTDKSGHDLHRKESISMAGLLFKGAGPVRSETSIGKEDLRGSPLLHSLMEPIDGYADAMSVQLKMTTPKFLREKFNFNLSLITEESYQYILYGHPRAVIANKMQEDASVYHESGIIIPEKSKGSENNTLYFKSWPHYLFLLQTYAFTLSTPKYHFRKPEIRKLLEIYFFKVNTIFPILSEQDFWAAFNAGTQPTIIIYAMVLLVLKDKLAEKVLRTVFSRITNYIDSEEVFYENLNAFTNELDFKIRQLNLILENLGDYNKVNRLVTMLLLSLHYRFDRSAGEQSSQDLTCGINLAFSLAIHMKPAKKFFTPDKAEYLTDLWWTCYVMDRFNSVTNFRCFFIKHEDFNIDLPYGNLNLLRMVQLAKGFENMLVALYQPFNNIHVKNQNNDVQSRLEIFNAVELQTSEFNLCDHEINSNIANFIDINSVDDLESHKSNYIESTIHLLTRLINNTIILVSQKGFFNDSAIHNLTPKRSILRASGNVLWYMRTVPENLLLQAPIVIFCLLISMSCSLKLRARNVLGTVDSEVEDVKPSFEIEGYILELEKFRREWWVVDDIYKLAKDFIEKLTITEKKRRDIELSLQNLDNKFAASPEATKFGGLRSTGSAASINNLLQVAEQDSNDNYSIDGSNLFWGWDFSKIAQYDNFFDSMQDDLYNLDMFTM